MGGEKVSPKGATSFADKDRETTMIFHFRKPRFTIANFAVLIAALAVVLATLPQAISPVAVGLIVVFAGVHAVIDRVSLLEWLILASSAGVLIGLCLPAVRSHCGSRPLPLPPSNAATTNPLAVPSPAP
jgi:hypothetical protein